MAEPTNSQLASQITTLLQKWNAREAEFRDWLAGLANGGPNGDGKFPLTDASGRTELVLSPNALADAVRSEEHTSELQSLMRISYAVFCLKKKNINMENNETQVCSITWTLYMSRQLYI